MGRWGSGDGRGKLRRARGGCGEARGCGRAGGALTRGGRAQALQAPGARRGAAHATSAAATHHAAAVRVRTGGEPRAAAAAAGAQVPTRRTARFARATRRLRAGGPELQPQAGGVPGSIPAARPWLRAARHRGAPASKLRARPRCGRRTLCGCCRAATRQGAERAGPAAGRRPAGRRALARAHADLGRGRGPRAALGPHRGHQHRRAGVGVEAAPCCGVGEREGGSLRQG